MSVPALNRFLEATVNEKIDPYTMQARSHGVDLPLTPADRKPSVLCLLRSAVPYLMKDTFLPRDAVGLALKYNAVVPNPTKTWTDNTAILTTNVAGVLQGSTLQPSSAEANDDETALVLPDGTERPSIESVNIDFIDFSASLKVDKESARPAPVIGFTVVLPIFFNDVAEPFAFEPYIEGEFTEVAIVSSNGSFREFTLWQAST